MPRPITEWSDVEIKNLIANYVRLDKNEGGVYSLAECQLELSHRRGGRAENVAAKRNRNDDSTSLDKAEIVNSLAENFLKLPNLAERARTGRMEIVLDRECRQKNPLRTVADLWHCYITCALSTQERVSADSPYTRFCKSGHALLYLTELEKTSVTKDWVRAELSKHLPRMLERRSRMVVEAYGHFKDLGTPDSNLEESNSKGPLSVFVESSKTIKTKKQTLDADIQESEAFSANLNPNVLFNIGHKQLRNILVNSGLAVNVIPIDSRWLNFMGLEQPLNLQNKSEYLRVEGFVRAAFLKIRADRPDISNLAMLDSLVFSQSAA
jgi:hypothetical protein